MSRIVAVAPVLPEHSASQQEITAELADVLALSGTTRAVFERMHAGTGIATRSTVLPLAAYRDLGGFGETNRIWAEAGTALAARAVRDALAAAGLEPADVDHLFFTSVTGAAAPSIDSRLAGELGFRRDLKRIPSFGLGCVAGAAGIARVHDYLAGHPDGVALVVALELCSLTLQRDDDSVANAVASGLFGDGAAAVVVVGDARARRMGLPGADVVATLSSLYPDSASVLGFDLGGTGFRIVLTAEVAESIAANFPGDVRSLLSAEGLGLDDIGAWIAHPGGPRVLEAFEHSIGAPDGAFAASWDSLRRVGNLSSASVLHVLADSWAQEPGTRGLLFALGPGVTSEVLLLEWAA
jgi:alkylresorcinol/alkylpyrone synthase